MQPGYAKRVKRLYHAPEMVRELTREPGLLRTLFSKKQTMALVRPWLVTSLVKPAVKGRVLEVGIGAGPLTKRLLEQKGVQEIHGVDISLPLLRKARARGARAVLGMGEQLPFKPGTFDSAMCLDTLGHIEDPVWFMRSIRKALKPGGTVVLNVPEKGFMADVSGGIGELRYKSFSREEIEGIMRRSGLEIEKTKKVSFLPIVPVNIFVYARKPPRK